MAEVLYLDFSSNTEINEEYNHDRIYKVGLKDQFSSIFPEDDYEDFIRQRIGLSRIKVGVSFPNFERKPPSGDGRNGWSNIAVRIHLDADTDLVMMCDLGEYKPKNNQGFPVLRYLRVKGFTTLDRGTVACGEIEAECDVAVRLVYAQEWYCEAIEPTRYLSAEQVGRSLFSLEFMERLNGCYVAEPHERFLETLDRWDLYIRSRREIIDKDLDAGYSCDSEPEVLMSYFRPASGDAEKDDPLPYLELSGDGDVWSASDAPGSQMIPLLHIVHDFDMKSYRGDVSLRRDFERFVNNRSLILSEQVSFEGKGQGRPVYRSMIQLRESRVSYSAGEEVIRNEGKIAHLMHERDRKVEECEADGRRQLKSETDSLMADFERSRLPDQMASYEQEVRREVETEAAAERDLAIAQERRALEKEASDLETRVAEQRAALGSVGGDRTDSDTPPVAEHALEELESSLEANRVAILSIEDRHPIEDLIRKMISPRMQERRKDLLRKEHERVEKDLRKRVEAFIEEKKRAIEDETNIAIRDVVENETRMRLHVFFRLDSGIKADPDSVLRDVKERCTGKQMFLYKDPMGEIAVLDRQSSALYNLKHGFVMNPFLATALSNSSRTAPRKEADVERYYSQRLNPKQREAVGKALGSNGMFLIRGPPGTGKTEVIAEIAAQYASRGRKVLIASENNKAVDNAFQRLPELPFLRCVRLFGGYSSDKAERNPYSVDRLTGNFYRDIADHLDGEVSRSVHARDYAARIDEVIPELRSREAEVERLGDAASDVLAKADVLEDEIRRLNRRLREDADDNADYVRENYALEEKIGSIERAEAEVFDSETGSVVVELDGRRLSKGAVRAIYALRKTEMNREFKMLENRGELSELLRKRSAAVDLDERARAELAIQDYAKESGIDLLGIKLIKVFPEGIPDRDTVLRLKEQVDAGVRDVIDAIEDRIQENKSICTDTSGIEKEIRAKERELQELRSDPVRRTYENARDNLISDVRRMMSDNGIEEDISDPSEGIGILEREKDRIARSAENGLNGELQDAFRRMSSYLRDETVVKADSEELNGVLLDYSNVIGLTCTTKDTVRTNAGEVDLKRVNIDVVIVDEVSKSSFLEILYPIMFGKTVVLVGDDRQLPPTYPSLVSEDDMFRYDPSLVNKDLESEFRHMYEHSFFAEMYESAPASGKTMLTVQYRMHPDIMDADNIFYGGKLTFGGAKGSREHYLEIKGAGQRRFISRDTHLVFIDVDGQESKSSTGGTTRMNAAEADVVVSLLKSMERCCMRDRFGESIGGRRFDVDDTRLSLGVICGYAGQAKAIRGKLRGFKFQSFNRSEDEQFMVDTVDNFQGDERDIIVLSLVVTDTRKRTFMTMFNRINVAVSRARCLLVIVGNSRAFSSFPVDIDGKREYVYRSIVDMARRHHGYITARDVLGERSHETLLDQHQGPRPAPQSRRRIQQIPEAHGIGEPDPHRYRHSGAAEGDLGGFP